jgi:uncharacterized membrane protein AbrB (regulator of aidB expression)
MSAALKTLRWLLVLPAAVAVVPLVDGVAVALLERAGAGEHSLAWLAGKALGHFVMGAGAIAVGTWMAPSRRSPVAKILFVLAILAAIEAAASGELPLWLILPLDAAFLLGAWVALRRIRPD